MAGPYRGVNLVLQIDSNGGFVTVGVVDGSDIDFGYEGGPEACYGTRVKSHSAGSKRIPFTVTRWYYTDSGQQDLLLDLFKNETEFTLQGYLVDKDGIQISNTKIKLTGCRIYRFHLRTGGADDILGEEGSGWATNWDFTEFINSP